MFFPGFPGLMTIGVLCCFDIGCTSSLCAPPSLDPVLNFFKLRFFSGHRASLCRRVSPPFLEFSSPIFRLLCLFRWRIQSNSFLLSCPRIPDSPSHSSTLPPFCIYPETIFWFSPGSPFLLPPLQALPPPRQLRPSGFTLQTIGSHLNPCCLSSERQ